MASRAADPGADDLDRGHQWIGGRYGPAHAVAEPGAGLAVCRNAAGVVVRRTGNQTRPDEIAEPEPLARSFGGFSQLGTLQLHLAASLTRSAAKRSVGVPT